MPDSSRVAVVHEWVAARAGSEKVFETLAAMWPDADLYALSVDPTVHMDFSDRSVRTTVLNHPQLRNRRSLSLPLMPLAWQMMPKRQYDLVITSHHAFAASNRLVKTGGTHLAYVHTPARYVWSPELDGRGTSPALTPVREVLKRIDLAAVRNLTGIAANSGTVAERIARYWDREATVIHPAVDTDYFTPGFDESINLDLPEQYILGFGRWIPYKNMDVVIEIAEKADVPCVIAGRGPLKEALLEKARFAGVPVKIIESPVQDEVRELYRRAKALVFPTDEDFGLIPVEAMACGTPVIALNKGGASETVVNGVSGALVDVHNVGDYAEALSTIESVSAESCRARAEEFSPVKFTERIQAWVANYTMTTDLSELAATET